MARRKRSITIAPTPVTTFSRRDPRRERRNRRLILGGVIVTLAVILAVAVFGYVETYVKPPRRVVLEVGERRFTAGQLERRVAMSLAEQGSLGQQQQLLPDIGRILERMRDEEILRRATPQVGITFSPDELNEALAERLGTEYGGPGSAFDSAYREELRRTGLRDREYREMVAAEELEKRLRAFFEQGLPDTSDQVQLEMILVPTEEEARTVIDRITKGEEFSVVAQSASRDTETASLGGMRDWTPRGVLAPELEQAVFKLRRGKLSEPIKTADGYYVVRVTDRRSDAFIEEAQRTEMVDEALENWMASRAQALGVRERLSKEVSDWVLTQALTR